MTVSGDVDWVAVKLAAPTIEQWGTDDQKARFLPGIRDGRTHWCQLFSEPGAGSDLAGLATRAVRDGESWVVSGQKVWTSLADTSDYGLLLARTDPDQPKHRGITYFIVDLRSDGIDVRPLRQMTGEVRFNEVFLSEVLVPDDMRLGPVNDGWRVSLSTLASERAELSSRRRDDSGRTLPLITQAKASGAWADPVVRERLMGLYSRERALEFTNLRAQARLASGAPPGPEGSVGKLLRSELSQSIARLAIDLRGPAGFAWAEDDEAAVAPVVREFLYSPAHTIAGGTSQVQRNIIGERVLGLPREPGSDKDMAWKDIPRQ